MIPPLRPRVPFGVQVVIAICLGGSCALLLNVFLR